MTQLQVIAQKARMLQLMVAGAGVESELDTSKIPPLPSNLVRAFENIVMAYVLMAKRLSLDSRWMKGDSGSTGGVPNSLMSKVNDIIRRGEQCLYQAGACLDGALTDIMLFGTTSSMGSDISLESIGGEVLVAVIVGKLQKQGLNSESRPSELLKLYQMYTAKLQFRATQRPQRKLFLDIQALQDELGALQNVGESQRNLLADYVKLSSPHLSPDASATRRNSYTAQKVYCDRLQQELRARDAKLDILQERAKVLRVRVLQSIEILEEGHGRAIRVFTVVTLFFLPL